MDRVSMSLHESADRPRVTVVTPAHNSEHTIEATVLSVARQTITSLEHIVIDDGSHDATPAILQRLSAELPHLRVVSQENAGAGAARNAGIRLAQGTYVAFLDGDDLWYPHKLEHQLDFMESTGAQFSYGNYLVKDDASGKVIGRYDVPESLEYSDLLRGCPIGCLTAAYNQDLLGKMYMPNVRRGQDWGLWLAITRLGITARRYPGDEAIYLRRQKSLSKNKLRKFVDLYGIYRNEEGMGHARSLYYLSQLSMNFLRKRPSSLG